MDDVFDRAMTFSTSSSVNSQVTKGVVGEGASGIHDGGGVKDLLKCDSASYLLNVG